MEQFLNPAIANWEQLCKRPQFSWDELTEKVKPVLQEVKRSGDEAIKKYTKQWDNASLSKLAVEDSEIQQAIDTLDPSLKAAMEVAAKNIKAFHLLQKDPERIIETTPGVICWQKSVPIQKVGLYIPGGSAPLFSTVLMLAIPAVIAGCQLIQLVTPPNQEGQINPAILYAAHLAGVQKIFKAGGAQAIAGLIFGTETIEPVDKIFGPGNQYVTAAKQMALQYGVAIDLPAGPSEVLVMIDDSADPKFVASDLLAQAEHGTDSQVVLVADEHADMQSVLTELEQQMDELPRKNLAQASIENSIAVQFSDKAQMIAFVNKYAAEHLIIAMNDAESIAEEIQHAGSVFLGHYTPESIGDYASGTNHTLPTNGYARNYSGVNLDAFVKKITYQKLTEEGMKNLGPKVVTLAMAEELAGHAKAVQFRLDKLASS